MNLTVLYWRAFWPYFWAVALPFFSFILPILVWDAAVHHAPQTTLWLVGFAIAYSIAFLALSWPSAWYIVALADSKDEKVRREQLEQLCGEGKKALLYTSWPGWLCALFILGFRLLRALFQQQRVAAPWR